MDAFYGIVLTPRDVKALKNIFSAASGVLSPTIQPPYHIGFFMRHHGIDEWQDNKCVERKECITKFISIGVLYNE